MSDVILKFWAKEEVSEIKVDSLKNQLLKSKVIAVETVFWRKPVFKTCEKFNSFFEPVLSYPNELYRFFICSNF